MNWDKLYRLQQLEVAEQGIQAERLQSTEYKELLAIKSAYEQKKRRYTEEKQHLEQVSQLVEELPRRISQQEQKAEAEQTAIYDGSVTSPKALAAREAQLAAIQQKLVELHGEEEKYLEEAARQSLSVSEMKDELEHMKERFAAVKDDYARAQGERDQRTAELETEKEQVLGEISSADLSWYNSAKVRFTDGPVACLDSRRICSGCFTEVPAIIHKRALMGQMVHCEKCGRSLFVKE